MNRIAGDRMKTLNLQAALLLLGCAAALGCSGDDTTSYAALYEVSLPPWDGGDAACTIDTTAVTVGCASGHRIDGDPYRCPGFSNEQGSASECSSVCGGPSGCALSGLSDGTSAVVCLSHCSNNAH